MVGLGFLISVAVTATFLPMLVSLDPTRIDLTTKASQPPGPGHLLGTDPSNRDNLARLVFGARTSLTVGFGAVAVSLLIGVTLGLLAGYYGGGVDQVIGRLADIVLSVPSLLMIIVFVSLVGPSIESVIVVVALLTWPGACRLVRGQILSLREAEFITAARAIGVSDRGIVFRHLLPNAYGPLSVVAMFGVAGAIVLEASLSFLGLGVRPPESSWGVMVNLALSTSVLNDKPWIWVPPAVAIALTVLSVTLIGDALRDAFDPRSRRRN
jgi:peptide/nickel transport system permease protein